MNKMDILVMHIEVVTDHAPLLPVYNAPNKSKQFRVDWHRIKLLPFQYNIVYEPGKMTPCDYGSSHPLPNTNFTEEERVDWAIEDETHFRQLGHTGSTPPSHHSRGSKSCNGN